MKYEAGNDNSLRVTIQAGHRLWRLFRYVQTVAVNYNLRRQGEDPLPGLVNELFPNDVKSYEVIIREAAKGIPSVPSQFRHKVEVYRTAMEVYGAAELIVEYIAQKLMLAGKNLLEKGIEFGSSPFLLSESDQVLKRQQKISDTAGVITRRVEYLVGHNFTILFEGTEDEHPYVFDRKRRPKLEF